MSARSRVLFIGLDAADPELVDAWIKTGDLPFIGSLVEAGLWCDVPNLPGFGNGAYWPSMYTGTNPARHGRYKYLQMLPGTYKDYLFSEDRDLNRPPFWELLSRRGKHVAAIDMVSAPLTTNLSGLQIVEWATHVRSHTPRSWPPEAIAKVIEHYGEDPFRGKSDIHGNTLEDYKRILASCLDRIEAKTRMCCDYLENDRWDLFLTVFADAHDIGHTSWHLHDNTHPDHDPHLAHDIGDPLKAVYVALDAAVGRIAEAAGPEATLFVMGGPGMGPNFTATDLLDDILRRWESGPANPTPRRSKNLKAMCRRVMPASLRKHVRPLLNHLGIPLNDRARRLCFALTHNESSGAVRFNLKGREPHGRIEPGAPFEQICNELENDLLQLVNADTGEPVVERVVRVAELCDGERLEHLPDLLVLWARPSPIRAVTSPKTGEVRRSEPLERTGDHNEQGFLIARGTGIAPSRLFRSVPVTAVAPTVTGMLGVPMPEADSGPIPELCNCA